jgi:predicted nucleotide-binding protein
MNANELRAYLVERHAQFQESSAPHNAIRFDCTSGEVYTAFPTGKALKQGKRGSELTNAIEALEASAEDSLVSSETVFIVYGHDSDALDELELIIRRMDLQPIILGNLAGSGDTIIEKVEQYIGEHGKVGYACVLLTPDDVGHRAGHPSESMPRARQNVVLELGMVLIGLGRKRVAIIYKEGAEKPSDINGLIYIPFKDRVSEVTRKLFKDLELAGLKPSSAGL